MESITIRLPDMLGGTEIRLIGMNVIDIQCREPGQPEWQPVCDMGGSISVWSPDSTISTAFPRDALQAV